MAALAALRSLRERRPRFVAVALLAFAALLAYPAVDWWLRSKGVAPAFSFWDFGAYGGAIDRWQAGEPLYVRNDDGGFHGSYLYPPVALLLFVPFTSTLPPLQARIGWVVVSTGLLWVALQFVVAKLGLDLAWPERGLLLWLLLGFQPLLLAVKMGQTAAFLAAMLCFALAGLLEGERRESTPWRVASGGFTALVGVVKLPYAPTGAHLLRDRARFAGAVVTGLGLLALSVLLFGVEAHRTYVDVLQWGLDKGGDARSPALWMTPYYRPLSWLPGTLVVRLGASLVIAAAALVHTGPHRDVFALGVAAFPLLAPLPYTYYLVGLLPAFVVLLATELERGGYPTVPVVALLFAHLHSYGLKFVVDVMPTLVPAWTALRPVYPLLQPGLWASALLAGLAAVRVGENVWG